jgi:hypothetical protein
MRWLVAAALLGGCPTSTWAPVDMIEPEDPTAIDDPGGLEGRRPTSNESRVIEGLAGIAERSRGLGFRDRVEVRIQTRAEIVRYIFREVESEELEKSRAIYAALGLLPADMDVVDLLRRVLGEQIAGYYDEEQDYLVLRDDVMRLLGSRSSDNADEARITIVHELVHALQDQNLGMGQILDDEEADSDPRSAYKAVVEGDATLAMIGYLSESLGRPLGALTSRPEVLRDFVSQAESSERDPELARAPAILRVTLLSSYLDGLLFCAALHARGNWGAIDDAHRSPPVSTEQVLHPERYARGELPDEVVVPPFEALTARGFERIDDDRLGELELRVYFGQLVNGVDERAAEGWAGDQLAAYRNAEGRIAIVWFTTWDTVDEAVEAEQAALRVQTLSTNGPDDAVVRDGRAVSIVRALPSDLHPTVTAAFHAFASALPPSPPATGGAP